MYVTRFPNIIFLMILLQHPYISENLGLNECALCIVPTRRFQTGLLSLGPDTACKFRLVVIDISLYAIIRNRSK